MLGTTVIAWQQGDQFATAAVASHVHATLNDHLIDVASSDRHTVKPGLAGKAPLATSLVDLAGEGYVLSGGRVDSVGDVPVPTLVYRHREHFISLTELSRGSSRASTPSRDTVSGHSVVTWSDNVRRYVAVSDMPPQELEDFVATFRSAAANEREDTQKGK